MNEKVDSTIEEIIRSVQFLINQKVKKTTQCYDGLVVSFDSGNKWNIKYNGEIHSIQSYGDFVTQINSVVKVFIPQGNQSLSWFFVVGDGGEPIPIEGDKTYVFTQQTASDSWLVNHNLNKYPSVTVVDSGNNIVMGEVIYLNANSLTINFNNMFSGKAYIN